jgi:hypothetical protein
MFDPYFKVTPTLSMSESLKMVYPAMVGRTGGVMVSEVGTHERGLRCGDIVVSIADQPLDSFGHTPDGMPYFCSFKDFPADAVRLEVAREGAAELETVMYRYDRINVKNLPTVHAMSMTPFESHPPVILGGVTVTQLTQELAMRFGHSEYMCAPKNNDMVFVCQGIHPGSGEWVVQRISPGSLMTHINFKKLEYYGHTDHDVWEWVNEHMSSSGVQHITVSFKCKALEGGVREVHNVYAINNIAPVTAVPHACSLCASRAST